jgi:hypothetical protein
MSTFADLSVGATFEFDHSDLHEGGASCAAIAHGPWRKRTKLTYVYADNRSTQHFRVRSNRVKVRQARCGGED